MSFKNILVPYDFEPISGHALDNALKIAELVTDSNITLIHVLAEITIPPTLQTFGRRLYSFNTGEMVTSSIYVKELYREMRSDVLKKIKKKTQKCEKAGISCQVVVLVGDPKEQILKYIQEKKIDLVVMGIAKRKGIYKIMTIGSVARNISEAVTCPIMLVH